MIPMLKAPPTIGLSSKVVSTSRGTGHAGILLWFAVLVTSCGGGEGQGDAVQLSGVPKKEAVGTAGLQPVPGSSQKEAEIMKAAAALNRQELEEAESEQQMQGTAGRTEPSTLNAFTKAGAASVPVYRFYNASTGAHFYTTNTAERDSIRARLPSFSYEGTAFEALAQAGAGLAPVYRFYNTQTGVHFYTISESEKNLVRDSLPQFRLEGVAYYASQVPATGFRPLYRSYVLNKGFHFYSVNASETAGLAQYRAEGVGYYVVGTAPAPDPGTTDATCQLANFQVDLMQQINAARAVARSCGGTARPAANAVSWDAALAAAAVRHSSDMAQNNFFSHTGSDGSTVGLRATAAGYSWSGIGENIAAGHTSVSAVMSGWLGSEGHCNYIMNSAYTHVALACVAQPGTTYTRYWTMVLGRH